MLSSKKSNKFGDTFEAESFDDRSEESGSKNADQLLKSHMRKFYIHNMDTKGIGEIKGLADTGKDLNKRSNKL